MRLTLVAILVLCGALSLTVAGQQKPAAAPQKPVATQQKPATPAQTAEAALGAAIHQQEAEKDLPGAIASYKAFLARYGSNRPLAAQAQYRLGQAYEKLGDAQARQVYERVVRDFADQKGLVTNAKERLAVLSVPRTSDATATRLVLTGEDNFDTLDAAISPDGRWLAMWSPAPDGNLILRDLVTGQVRRLPAGTCVDRRCGVGRPVFSSNGRQLAYQWRDNAANSRNGELRIIGTEPGAKPRVVPSDPKLKLNVVPTDWAPDGRAILATLGATPLATLAGGRPLANLARGTSRLGWVSVADGTVTVVKSLRDGELFEDQPRVSPDGKYIVYSRLAGAGLVDQRSPETQIYVVARDGSSEAQLTSESANLAPVWMGNGSVVFVSNRAGSYSLWAASVRDGKAGGPPILVKKDIGRVRAVGMTRSGSYLYVHDQNAGVVGYNVFEAALDPLTGKATSPVQYLSERFVGQNCCAAWSPDGRFVAFKRFRIDNPTIRDVVVRTVDSGAERTYMAPDWVNTPYGFGPGAPKWLGNGSGLFVGDEPIVGQARWLGRMELDGRFAKFVEIPASLGWVAALSPDARTAYVLSRKGDPIRGTYAGVVAVDLTTGEQRPVFNSTDGRVYSVDVSSDGRMLALWVQPDTGGRPSAALATMQVDGSGYRELYVTTKTIATVPDQVQWSKDGSTLIFQEAGRFMRVSAQGGAAEFTGLARQTPEQAHGFRVSADGSRVGITEGARLTLLNEVWALDNIQSLLKPR